MHVYIAIAFLPLYCPFMIGLCAGSSDEPRRDGTGMQERAAMLSIRVGVGPGGDAEEIAEATARLRRELLDLDVDAVELPSGGEPPPGTRAVDLASLGALVVTVAQSQLLGLETGTPTATRTAWLPLARFARLALLPGRSAFPEWW
jgi:hypothetical protein